MAEENFVSGHKGNYRIEETVQFQHRVEQYSNILEAVNIFYIHLS